MIDLAVDIEINGKQVHIGDIHGSDTAHIQFRYDEQYLAEVGQPLSISMPVQAEAFDTVVTRNFFEGLLPEGFTRRTIASHMRLDNGDYIGLLTNLGQECLGAIRIYEAGDPGQEYRRHAMTEDRLEPLSEEQVCDLAREGVVKSTEILAKTHLSLTGASGKVGLYYELDGNSWYLPLGLLPSTHIVKLSHVRLEGIVANEQLSLMTAQKLGINTPESFIINVGQGEDSQVLFATKRYDRKFKDATRTEDGHLIPYRLHQEDFAQALSIHGSDKYESVGGAYMQKIFELVRKNSVNPIEDELRLWDILVYDYLIGNTDNHIKNCSFLYQKDLKGVRLAPAYDILSTSIYDSSTRDMAISVNDKFCIDTITRDDFEAAASKAGLGRKLAMNRFDRMVSAFEQSLADSANELGDMGFQKAADIRERILATSGYHNL